MKTFTLEELKNYNFNKSKYNNSKTEYKGFKYDSKKEAGYAHNLDLAMKSKTDPVIKWERQVKYSIDINKKHICNYILDFKVYYKDRIEHIDVKGYKKGPAYSMFKLKKKLVEAIHNIEIIEV